MKYVDHVMIVNDPLNTGEIDVLLVPRQKEVDHEEKERFFSELEKGLEPMEINIRTVEDVIYTEKGKFRVIVREDSP